MPLVNIQISLTDKILQLWKVPVCIYLVLNYNNGQFIIRNAPSCSWSVKPATCWITQCVSPETFQVFCWTALCFLSELTFFAPAHFWTGLIQMNERAVFIPGGKKYFLYIQRMHQQQKTAPVELFTVRSIGYPKTLTLETVVPVKMYFFLIQWAPQTKSCSLQSVCSCGGRDKTKAKRRGHMSYTHSSTFIVSLPPLLSDRGMSLEWGKVGVQMPQQWNRCYQSASSSIHTEAAFKNIRGLN